MRRLETIYSLTRKNEQRRRRETEANRGSVRNRAWSQSPASRLTARCAIQRVRLMLRKSFGFDVVFFLSACVKVNMYLGPEPVSAFRLPGDKHASEILCEHPALRALKHQLVHGVICMLILLLFSTHPTCICAKKITLLCRKVKCFLCALPFSIGFSWTITAFWDKWHSKRIQSWFPHIPSNNPEIVMNCSHSWITHCYS